MKSLIENFGKKKNEDKPCRINLSINTGDQLLKIKRYSWKELVLQGKK
jgi:hypothetical protein